MNIKIFVMTHKRAELPRDRMYVPLQVGHALHGTIHENYLRDDDGEDNISVLNPYFSELTGMYWVWKQCRDTAYVGICHYRRFPVVRDGAAERLLTEKDCERILREYDLITTEKLNLHSNYYDGFAVDHNLCDLQATAQAVKEKYPAYYGCFEELLQCCEIRIRHAVLHLPQNQQLYRQHSLHFLQYTPCLAFCQHYILYYQ